MLLIEYVLKSTFQNLELCNTTICEDAAVHRKFFDFADFELQVKDLNAKREKILLKWQNDRVNVPLNFKRNCVKSLPMKTNRYVSGGIPQSA